MKRLIPLSQTGSLACILLLLLILVIAGPALATELPPTVRNYVTEKDPQAHIRFDGVVIFSNGEMYLPVIPQAFKVNPNPGSVRAETPVSVSYPDLVHFDNDFFLVRLIQSKSGRLTLPDLASYPIEMKEGLLPQDLVLPDNLFIPTELKVILGQLPYNPSQPGPQQKKINPPAAITLKPDTKTTPIQPPKAMVNDRVYLYSLDDQQLVTYDMKTAQKTGQVDIGCLPSDMVMGRDGKLLFVSCIRKSQVVAVDVTANLVKTRIQVASNPGQLLLVGNNLIVGHRFEESLEVIDTGSLSVRQRINLPGQAGALRQLPKTAYVFVADAFGSSIYQVNLKGGAEQTSPRKLEGLPGMSDMVIIDRGQLTEDRDPELWVASRTQHKVRVINLLTGDTVMDIAVGKKPLALVQANGAVLSLSANDSQLDQIDISTGKVVTRMPLGTQSFPSDVAVTRAGKSMVVSAANTEALYVVNLQTPAVDKVVKTPFTALTIAAPVEQAPTSPAQSPMKSESAPRETIGPAAPETADPEPLTEAPRATKTMTEEPVKASKRPVVQTERLQKRLSKPRPTASAEPGKEPLASDAMGSNQKPEQAKQKPRSEAGRLLDRLREKTRIKVFGMDIDKDDEEAVVPEHLKDAATKSPAGTVVYPVPGTHDQPLAMPGFEENVLK